MSKCMIAYRRVSTDDQADKGYSLPSQLESIKNYADACGFALIDEDITGPFAEDYSGATPLAERPVGQRVVAMLKRREADGIIVHHIDRLSRDLVDALMSVRDFTQAGLEVHACEVGRIGSETDITLIIKAWQASDERKKITERMTRGRNAKAKAGKVVGNGWPLYGYRFTTNGNGNRIDGFEIYEPEAAIVRNIFRWYVLGDESKKPLTCHEITIKLSTVGIPTPVESQGRTIPRKKAAGIWNHTTVARILANETYAGLYHYGKVGTQHKGVTRNPHSKSYTIAVDVPAIVDRTLWEAAQHRRESNKGQSRRNAKHEYLLTSLVKCGCGYSMTGATKQTWRYYRCGAHSTKLTGLEEICHQAVDAGKLEQAVWHFVTEVITQRDQFLQWIREAQTAELEAMQPRRDELKNIETLIGMAEKEAEEVAAAMKHARGLVSKKLEAQADEIDRRYNKLRESRDKIKIALDAAVLTDESIMDLMRFAQTVSDGLADPTFEQKRRWLGYLKVKIVVTDKVAAISCRLPVNPAVIDLHSSKSTCCRRDKRLGTWRVRCEVPSLATRYQYVAGQFMQSAATPGKLYRAPADYPPRCAPRADRRSL